MKPVRDAKTAKDYYGTDEEQGLISNDEREVEVTVVKIGDGFDQPAKVTDVQIAFPADALDYMPEYENIPKEFRHPMGTGDAKKWVRFVHRWFSRGFMGAGSSWPRPDVDAEMAYRHLSVIMGSYAPKHEHKVAAAAWLMSRWFADVSDEPNPKAENNA